MNKKMLIVKMKRNWIFSPSIHFCKAKTLRMNGRKDVVDEIR
jgi:hypothetical protein